MWWLLCFFSPAQTGNVEVGSRLNHLTQTIENLHLDAARLADIQIYQKAAAWAIRFDSDSAAPADILQAIDHGLARAADTSFAWEAKKGGVVRAYRSRIDDSVQPYALVIPEAYDGSKPMPLVVVLHDRDDRLNELNFLAAHETGSVAPSGQDSIQLEVFGRGNNGYRWAGETDIFEALDSVRARYRIDDRKITLRGIGMGGTAALELAMHYPDLWASVEAKPKVYAKPGPLVPYQEAARRTYDAIDPISNKASNARDGAPDHIHFVTYTPAYHRSYWISIEGMQRQYERAEVDAQRQGDEVRVTTHNVSRLRIDNARRAIVDGQTVDLAGFGILSNTVDGWRLAAGIARFKKPGLQGPIDDAFREPFLCVRPTGKPEDKVAGAFVRETLEQFREEFAKWMRGEVRVKNDKDVTPDDIERYHLILFGDPSSNRLIKRVADKIMRFWPGGAIVPMLISPNPLNPERYVVLNSGHTFHEEEFKTSEALLYPRLGDFAIIDVRGRRVIRAGLFDSTWRQLVRYQH